MPPRLPTLDDMLAGRSPAAPPARPPIGRPVLTIRNLTVNYPGGNWLARSIRAVDSISLTLCAGETLGLVGESGSGKSTIANAIVGLCPSSGEISLFGQTLMRDRSPGHPRCQIVFQDSNGSLNPRLTVARILGEPLDRRRLYRGSVRRKRLVSLLAEVRLAEELLDRYPHELSGGQRQRVNIARALALDPEILICDEIVSALDVTVQAQVLNLLKDIQAARGLALLFISHDLTVVRFMADRVAVMAQGRIVETGPTSDVLDRPRHPYTQTLMSAIPQDPTVEAA
jgi:peptide/nickel transport system ATP-binding protein